MIARWLLVAAIASGCAAGTVRAIPAPASSSFPVVLPAIGEVELASGLTIAASRNTDVGVVRLAIAMRGGFGHDPIDAEGLARVSGAALALAARSPAHSGRFGEIGAAPVVEVTRAGLVVWTDVLPADAAAGAVALAQFVLAPEITRAHVERALEKRRAVLVESYATPSRLAALAIAQSFAPRVGATSGLGFGTRTSLARIDLAAVDAHLGRARNVHESAFLVAGPCDLANVADWARAAFVDWPKRSSGLPPGAARVARRTSPLIFVPVPGMRQALVVVGGLRPHVTDEHAVGHAAAVARLAGRIGYVMREERHASYGIGYDVETEKGEFVVSLRVRHDDVRNAVRNIRTAVDEATTAPTELWLAYFRVGMRAALMAEAQDVDSVVSRMAFNFLVGIKEGSLADSLHAIDALTDVEVTGAARRYLDEESLQIVVLGDPDAVASELEDGFVELRPTRLIDGEAAMARRSLMQ